MGLFGKKTKLVTCPICAEEFDPQRDGQHWSSHVEQIPPGQGDASGQYTWACACGPSGMKWPNDFSAAMALAIHMYRVHGIPVSSPLDNSGFLNEMERKLGMR